jgi:hypothetical protein
VVRPSTTITGSNKYLTFKNLDCAIALQRVYLSDSIRLNVGEMLSLSVCSVVSDSSINVYASGCQYLSLRAGYCDPDTFAWVNYANCGTAIRNEDVLLFGCSAVRLGGFYCGGLITLSGCGISSMAFGARAAGGMLMRDGSDINYGYVFSAASGYRTTEINGAGLTIESMETKIGDMLIQDGSGHGITVKHGTVVLESTGGSGNAGAGVYAHSGSAVHVVDGSPPTLTGAVGDLSTDGVSEDVKWSTIDAGNKFVDHSEAVIVKEV